MADPEESRNYLERTLVDLYGTQLMPHGAMLFASLTASVMFLGIASHNGTAAFVDIVFLTLLLGSTSYIVSRLLFYGQLVHVAIHSRAYWYSYWEQPHEKRHFFEGLDDYSNWIVERTHYRFREKIPKGYEIRNVPRCYTIGLIHKGPPEIERASRLYGWVWRGMVQPSSVTKRILLHGATGVALSVTLLMSWESVQAAPFFLYSLFLFATFIVYTGMNLLLSMTERDPVEPIDLGCVASF